MEASSTLSWSASSSSSHQKRKRNQVVPHGVIVIDGDDDTATIVDESTSDDKNKQPVGNASNWQKQIAVEEAHAMLMEVAYSNHDIGPSSNHNLKTDAPADTSKDSDPEFMDYASEADEEDYYDDDYDDYDYDTEAIETDSNYNLASKFDNLDLPPGVEATVPWLQKVAVERSINRKQKEPEEDEIDVKFNAFKRFDTVQDHSDHHFSKPELAKINPPVIKPTKDWAKRVQYDWRLLEKDLPDSIYVRAYEDRMDILRAVIVGPAGTPYHDGLFFFDIYFPAHYPSSPPLVHYHSGGLRLNPNLYACGKVCLSLLGTWLGSGCEKWNPSTSTMLQVLVSIQALVLNEKPYFNEPGYTQTANTPQGEKRSLAYNEDAFVLSLRTMLYSLRKPPKHFEDFVAGHFRNRGHAILLACKAYMAGTQVGSVIKEEEEDAVDFNGKTHTPAFISMLKKLFEDLLMEFTVKGADCKKFLAQKIKAGAAAGAAEATG